MVGKLLPDIATIRTYIQVHKHDVPKALKVNCLLFMGTLKYYISQLQDGIKIKVGSPKFKMNLNQEGQVRKKNLEIMHKMRGKQYMT